jgi:hypothetical protein
MVAKGDVPNEAVNSLKTKSDDFPTEPKAVRLLKMNELFLSSRQHTDIKAVASRQVRHFTHK